MIEKFPQFVAVPMSREAAKEVGLKYPEDLERNIMDWNKPERRMYYVVRVDPSGYVVVDDDQPQTTNVQRFLGRHVSDVFGIVGVEYKKIDGIPDKMTRIFNQDGTPYMEEK